MKLHVRTALFVPSSDTILSCHGLLFSALTEQNYLSACDIVYKKQTLRHESEITLAVLVGMRRETWTVASDVILKKS